MILQAQFIRRCRASNLPGEWRNLAVKLGQELLKRRIDAGYSISCPITRLDRINPGKDGIIHRPAYRFVCHIKYYLLDMRIGDAVPAKYDGAFVGQIPQSHVQPVSFRRIACVLFLPEDQRNLGVGIVLDTAVNLQQPNGVRDLVHALIKQIAIFDRRDVSLQRFFTESVGAFDYQIVVCGRNGSPAKCWNELMELRRPENTEQVGDIFLHLDEADFVGRNRGDRDKRLVFELPP